MKSLSNWIIQIYLFLMLGVFPLYYQDGYYNMGDAKYEFFKYATIVMLGVFAVVQLVEKIAKRESWKIRLSIQDITVLLYTATAILSFMMSPYRENTWIGSHEWYMGLLSQLLFIGVYFAVSRKNENNFWNLGILSISGALVFLISYLHRFRIDPLGLYEGIAEGYWIAFLGTIGNANWYSSYICVILPLVIGVYVFWEKPQSVWGKIAHVLNGAVILIGFATTVTQNSDSAYAGLALSFMFVLWFAMEKPRYLIRFLEVLLLGLSAAKITGYLQVTFPEHAIALSGISVEITQGRVSGYLLVVVFLVYLVMRFFKEKYTECWSMIRKLRNIFYIMLGIGMLAIPVIMWCISKEIFVLNEGLLSQTGYLVFNDRWGSNRGVIWKYAIQTFKEYPMSMKLFGCGPDALMWYSSEFHQAEVQAVWGNTILTNVHNEWLNMLINYGIFGAITYSSIFITCIVRTVKYWKEKPMLLAFGVSVIAYMGHNFFCFQQVVCTSLIFIVIAMTEKEITDLVK